MTPLHTERPVLYPSYGILAYGAQILSQIDFCGVLTLQGTVVQGLTTVKGSLNANQAKLNSLEASGTIDLKFCNITGAARISGSLKSENCTFSDILKINSKNIQLSETVTKDIFIEGVSDHDGQSIHLLKNTKVTGSITFEHGSGKVYLESGSTISGSIQNGTLINL